MQEQLLNAPTRPGVYLLIGDQEEILYVGKAKNIRKRVSSYFQKRPVDGKTAHLVSRVRRMETIITDSEAEALILENNLIKKHQPRYNIELKENESYPYIKITNETYPRILKTRIRRDDGARYFGPYTSAGAVNRTLRTIAEHFPVRRCRKRLDRERAGTPPRPCLNHTIGRCPGPCSGRISPEEYAGLVDQVILFLKGRSDVLLTRIRDEMERESGARNYEQALRLRERYRALERLTEEQKITTAGGEDEDIVGVAGQEGIWVVTVMSRRRGKITGKFDYTVRGGTDEQAVLEQFM
ncbi:MAG: excinuclease ABC subunit UvrC, partial [Spirochaetota bacterium]